MDNIIDYDLLKMKKLLEQLDEYSRPAQEFFGIRDEDIRKINDRISSFPENVYNVAYQFLYRLRTIIIGNLQST